MLGKPKTSGRTSIQLVSNHFYYELIYPLHRMFPPSPDANLSKVMPASRTAELHREDVQALLDLLSDILARSGGTTLDADSIWDTVSGNE